jgi:predicted aspartyl protease
VALAALVLGTALNAPAPWCKGAGGAAHSVPMYDKGARTFYVRGYVSGLGDVEMMVDTGSGYVTINQHALKRLTRDGNAHFVKYLQGVLADGQEIKLPLYSLAALRIGNDCWVHDVEAAVFPGHTRYLLGLSALAKAAPFTIALTPPQLTLKNCGAEAPLQPKLADTGLQ